MKVRFEKYKPLGGIEKATRLYYEKCYTFRKIAKLVNTSGTSVLNDFTNFLGSEKLREVREERAKIINNNRYENLFKLGKTVEISIEDIGTKNLLNNEGRVFVERLQICLPLITSVTFSQGKIKSFKQKDNSRGSIRYAYPNPRHKEYGMGLYRFNISEHSNKQVDHLLFILEADQKIIAYKFKPSDLGKIKSLNLAFINKDGFKYEKYMLKDF